MRTLVGYFLVGLTAALAGASYGAIAFALPPITVGIIDLGEVSLAGNLKLLVPVTNSHPYRVLRLTSIDTSCGCATALVQSLEIPPRSVGMLPVLVRPRPPETKVEFAVSAILDGGQAASIVVHGHVPLPFDGYPTHISSQFTDRGMVLPINTSAGFISRVDVFRRTGSEAVVSYWDSSNSEIVCPACEVGAELDVVLWVCDQAEPFWSGPAKDSSSSVVPQLEMTP